MSPARQHPSRRCGTVRVELSAAAPREGLMDDRTCMTCGEQLPAGATTCGRCGAPVSDPGGHSSYHPPTEPPARHQWTDPQETGQHFPAGEPPADGLPPIGATLPDTEPEED